MEGQRHAVSEVSFQDLPSLVTWSVKHLLLSSSALASSTRTCMDLCFLIYWLHIINVLMVTLKLECNILFILVCILTLQGQLHSVYK